MSDEPQPMPGGPSVVATESTSLWRNPKRVRHARIVGQLEVAAEWLREGRSFDPEGLAGILDDAAAALRGAK